MKSLWLSLLLLLIPPQETLATEKTLKLGIIKELPEDVTLHISNILTELYGRCGYEVKIRATPSARSIHMANTGQLDGESARLEFHKELYPNLVRVDEPLMIIEHIVLKKNDNVAIDNWTDLLPYRVGVIRGGIAYTQKLNAIDHQNVVVTNSIESMFNMLQRGRLDIIVIPRLMIRHFISQKEYKNLNLSSSSLGVSRVYTYLHKKHATLAIDAAEMLLKMKFDGSLDALSDELKKSPPNLN